VTSPTHGDKIPALLKRLRRAYALAIDADAASPEDPLLELVRSFLLWEAPRSKAELAMKRVQQAVVDINELRVCFPEEIIAILGERYPRVEERAQRLRAVLNDIYIREHAVSLDKLKSAGKREARQYLDSLDGMPQFVAARVFLLALGGHAVPLDDRMIARLAAEGVLEPGAAVEKAASALERHVKAGEAAELHMLLQAWADDGPASDRAPGRKKPAGNSAVRSAARRAAKSPSHRKKSGARKR